MPNHLDRQLEVHQREPEGEAEVATELGHQAERGVGEHLPRHRHRFSKHEDQPRIWDLGFRHKTRLDVHLRAGFVAGVVSRVAVLHVLFNRIFADIACTNTCVRIPECEKANQRSFYHYPDPIFHLAFAYSISQGVVQLNFQTNFWCKFSSLHDFWDELYTQRVHNNHNGNSFKSICKLKNLHSSSLPTIEEEHGEEGSERVINIL